MVDLEERVRLIHDINRFTVKSLGIKKNNLFKKRSDAQELFVVYASRKDRIKSVLGKWGNETFHDEEECLQRENELKEKGYDTFQTTFEAYGDEECQIIRSVINSSKTRLTYLVLHEHWHIQCIKEDIRLKPCIEEAVGDTFAYQGALLYYESNPHMITSVKRDFQEWQEFFRFMDSYLKKIEYAYQSDPSKVKGIIRSMRRRDKAIEERFRSAELKVRLAEEINNAYLLRQQYYAPMAVPVYEALKELHPREYATDKRVLYKALKGIK